MHLNRINISIQLINPNKVEHETQNVTNGLLCSVV